MMLKACLLFLALTLPAMAKPAIKTPEIPAKSEGIIDIIPSLLPIPEVCALNVCFLPAVNILTCVDNHGVCKIPLTGTKITWVFGLLAPVLQDVLVLVRDVLALVVSLLGGLLAELVTITTTPPLVGRRLLQAGGPLEYLFKVEIYFPNMTVEQVQQALPTSTFTALLTELAGILGVTISPTSSIVFTAIPLAIE